MKKIAAVLLAVFAMLVSSACSSITTDSDEVGLHYKGGSFSSKKFSNCVDPSNRNWDGPGDAHFYYPQGQRTYSFTGRKGSELKPILAKTSNSVNLKVAGYVTFHLNTDCKTLREFHEKIGRKYGAYSESSGAFSSGDLPKGWVSMLNDYLATPLNSSIDNAGLKFDWKTLAYDASAQSKFEEEVKENLPKQLNSTISKYLVIDSVSIQPPEPPQDLITALEASEKAKAENDAQKQKNATARTKYQSMADCKKELSERSCIILKLSEDGNVPFYIIPDGSGLNLGTPK